MTMVGANDAFQNCFYIGNTFNAMLYGSFMFYLYSHCMHSLTYGVMYRD